MIQSRHFRKLLAATAALGLVHSSVVSAQPFRLENEPLDLPDGPAAPGFDIDRFSNAGNGWFETFHVDDYEPLRDALDDGRLLPDTRMLIINTAGRNLAFVTDQMAYHHLAQGTIEGQHWLASF